MKLFETSQGFIFSFGFDMQTRKPRHGHVCWCDPITKSWEISQGNQAGWIVPPYGVAPEFIKEIGGTVFCYQSGMCVEFRYIGPPLVWSYSMLMEGRDGRRARCEPSDDEESLARIG